MTQLITMRETNQLILAKVHTILLKAKAQQLDSANVELLTPAIEQQILACHEAIIAQKPKLAPLDASSTSGNTPQQATSSAPPPHATTPVATSSKSANHADKKPAVIEVKRSFPRPKPSGNRTSNIYTFDIPGRKVAAPSSKGNNSNQAIKRTLNLPPKATATTADISVGNPLATPLLANEYKQDASTPKKPALRINIPPEPKDQIRILPHAENPNTPANALYKILVRALYTHEALNFLSEQVTIGGQTLDQKNHARVKHSRDYTPTGRTVATSMKLMVDTIGNPILSQEAKLLHLVVIAETAADQRRFCCFKPVGRTNASQAIYRTVGNIDLQHLTTESVNDIRNKLEKISPRLVEPSANAVVKTQQNHPA